MADFKLALKLLGPIEGGYVNRSDDYGGETKYGISKKQYPNLDIKNLSSETAEAIYEKDYWNKWSLSEIEDQTVASQLFLLFVNMQPHYASLIIQEAINKISGQKMVEEDGILGSKTRKAINSLNPRWLSDRIRLDAIEYYLWRTDEDKSQWVNFRGWVRRALR